MATPARHGRRLAVPTPNSEAGSGAARAWWTPPPQELVPVPDSAQAQALYSYFHAPSRIEVVVEKYKQEGRESIAVQGALMRDGKRIGEWQRHLGTERMSQRDGSLAGDPRLVATNSWLRIDEEADRRTGFGRAYTEELEKRYRELGVHRVDMWATQEGCFAWARSGYRFDTGRDYSPYASDHHGRQMTPLAEAAEAADMWCSSLTQNVVAELVAARRITSAQVQAAGRCFLAEDPQVISSLVQSEGALARGPHTDTVEREQTEAAARMATHPISTPAEFAALGEEEAWEEAGQRMWLGKAILLSPGYAKHGWHGWKSLER